MRDLLAHVSFTEQFVHSSECLEMNLCLDLSIQVLYSSLTLSSGTNKRVSHCSKKKDDNNKQQLETQTISCDLMSLRLQLLPQPTTHPSAQPGTCLS